MAMQMQSLLTSPMGSSNTIRSFGIVPMTTRHTILRISCSGKEGRKVNPPSTSSSSLSSTPNSPLSSPNPTPTPKALPKISTKLSDLLAFGGPAPERINGRLAMIGFVAAVAVELSSGTDLIGQISNGGGEWFLGTTILLSAASMVPLLKGKRAETKTDGLMNSNAEMWNGRFAMLGLVALAFTEFVKGGALI